MINCVGDDVMFEVFGFINYFNDDNIFGVMFIGLF